MTGGGQRRGLLAAFTAALLALATPPAVAAQMDGVALPDSATVGGSELRLNGIAVRTYSWLRVRIYVAGLYVQQPTHDAETILGSREKKMLVIRFVHDVDAENARKAWREGFADNCLAPCQLAPADEARFLAAVPAVRAGDFSELVFTPERLTISVNGHTVGTIADPVFERAVLATFIGPHPPTERLKQGLLGEG